MYVERMALRKAKEEKAPSGARCKRRAPQVLESDKIATSPCGEQRILDASYEDALEVRLSA